MTTTTIQPQSAVDAIMTASPIRVNGLKEYDAVTLLVERLFLAGESITLGNQPNAANEIEDFKDLSCRELLANPAVCRNYKLIGVNPNGATVHRHALAQVNQVENALALVRSGVNVSAVIQDGTNVWVWVAINATTEQQNQAARESLNALLKPLGAGSLVGISFSPIPIDQIKLLYLNPLAIQTSMAAVKKAQSALIAEAKAARIEAKQVVNQPILANLHPNKPMIQLPGEDRLLSDFASELADHVQEHLYIRNGEVVVLDGTELKPIKADGFRTWVEQHVICYRQMGAGHKMYEIGLTMGRDTAAGVLCSSQFLSKLRKIQQVNDCRLPVMRDNGTIELLPNGYDAQAQVLTIEQVKYDTEMSAANAKITIDDIFSEFVFADAGRSKSVVIAGMVGLYGKHLLPPLSLRPCFIMTANAEGAGKGLIASIMTMPALGNRPIGSKAESDDEMAKVIATAVKESRPLLFLDNVRGYLASSCLEAFLTAPKYEARKLGGNEFISGDNVTQVIITGNGLTVSPDIRRRSLFVELRLEAERAEDRIIKRPLEAATLIAMRPKLLAALWSLVKTWDEAKRPVASKVNAQLSSWSNIIAGIVESAGYGCPLETATVAIAADQDGKDMRTLVTAMAGRDEMEFRDVAELAKKLELFTGVLGEAMDLDRKARRIFSDILKKYNGRLVLNWKFRIEGEGHSRRYWVEDLTAPIPAVEVSKSEGDGGVLHDNMIQHDISASVPIPPTPLARPDYHVMSCIMQTDSLTQTTNTNIGATIDQKQTVVTTNATETMPEPPPVDDPYSFNTTRKELAPYF